MAPPLGKWLYPKSERVAMWLISGGSVTYNPCNNLDNGFVNKAAIALYKTKWINSLACGNRLAQQLKRWTGAPKVEGLLTFSFVSLLVTQGNFLTGNSGWFLHIIVHKHKHVHTHNTNTHGIHRQRDTQRQTHTHTITNHSVSWPSFALAVPHPLPVCSGWCILSSSCSQMCVVIL